MSIEEQAEPRAFAVSGEGQAESRPADAHSRADDAPDDDWTDQELEDAGLDDELFPPVDVVALVLSQRVAGESLEEIAAARKVTVPEARALLDEGLARIPALGVAEVLTIVDLRLDELRVQAYDELVNSYGRESYGERPRIFELLVSIEAQRLLLLAHAARRHA